MFSIFTYIMSRVTHSEPGLPMRDPPVTCTTLEKDSRHTLHTAVAPAVLAAVET